MATYTEYANGRPIVATGGSNAAGFPASTVMVNEFDASKRELAAGDIVELLKIPAHTFVHKVFLEVLEGEDSQTLNVGDGGDDDGYLAAVDVGTTGNVHISELTLADGTPNTVVGYTAGKLYSEEDTIDLEVPDTMSFSTLRVRVVAVVAAFG